MDPLDELARRFFEPDIINALNAIAHRFTSRSEVAEDLVAETIEEIIRMPEEKIKAIEDLKKFSKTILFRKAYKWSQSKQQRHEHLTDNTRTEIPYQAEPVYIIDPVEVLQVIKDHFNETDYRIFDLDFQGCSSKEIAGILNIKDGTVRTKVSRTLKWLRNYFKNAGR